MPAHGASFSRSFAGQPRQMQIYKRQLYHSYRLYSSLKYRYGRRLTPTAFLVLGALLLAAALGLDTNLSVAYQAFSLLLCLVIVSWSGAVLYRGRLSAERRLPLFGPAHDAPPH